MYIIKLKQNQWLQSLFLFFWCIKGGIGCDACHLILHLQPVKATENTIPNF